MPKDVMFSDEVDSMRCTRCANHFMMDFDQSIIDNGVLSAQYNDSLYLRRSNRLVQSLSPRLLGYQGLAHDIYFLFLSYPK
jgi:hypothetical protein